MFGPELEYPWLIAACAGLGLFAHILKKFGEAKSPMTLGALWTYLVSNAAQTMGMLAASAGLTLAFWSIDQLNGLTGFCVGYMGNSAADLVGARVVGSTKTEPKEKP